MAGMGLMREQRSPKDLVGDVADAERVRKSGREPAPRRERSEGNP
ncbi:MAG: hypothetical protein ACRDSJ_00745 [Rubrobacteraceae bacterium]